MKFMVPREEMLVVVGEFIHPGIGSSEEKSRTCLLMTPAEMELIEDFSLEDSFILLLIRLRASLILHLPKPSSYYCFCRENVDRSVYLMGIFHAKDLHNRSFGFVSKRAFQLSYSFLLLLLILQFLIWFTILRRIDYLRKYCPLFSRAEEILLS